MSKQKKFRDFSDLGNFVYSTNENFEPENEPENEHISPHRQELEAHFSKKGRGGKTVTIVKGFKGSEQELKLLGKQLKNKLGVGGSAKNGEIIIQGNNRDKIVEILKQKGFKVKKIGG